MLNARAFLSFDVTPHEDGMQLSSLLRSRFGISRSLIRRLKRDDCAEVDGVVVPMRHRLRAGDRVTLYLPPSLESNVEPHPLPLEIRYEDAHLIIVDKPAGNTCPPGGVRAVGNARNGVVFHLLSRASRPSPGRSLVSTAGVGPRPLRQTPPRPPPPHPGSEGRVGRARSTARSCTGALRTMRARSTPRSAGSARRPARGRSPLADNERSPITRSWKG